MPDTAVVWFRRDLRVRDLPALAHACREHERVVPLFVFDPRCSRGRFRSPRPHRVDARLPRGARRRAARPRRAPGAPPRAPADRGAPGRGRGRRRTPCTSPTTSRASRGRATRASSRRSGATGSQLVRHPGLYVADLAAIRTTAGGPYTVYSPFLRAWKAQERRAVERAPPRDRDAAHRRGPAAVAARAGLRRAARRGSRTARSPARTPPGAPRAAGCAGRASRATPSAATTLAEPTSRLSAYLRFGCLSPLGLERAVAAAAACARYRDQLAWRDFFGAVQLHFPDDRAHRVPGALPRPGVGPRRRAARGLARGPAPASRSSTPRCASSPRPAGCTTARA